MDKDFRKGRQGVKKEDLSVGALLLEAVTIVLGIGYIGLQIFYGVRFHIEPYRFIWNVLALVLVYAALLLLEIFPEKVNRLTPEMFTPRVRRYTLRMLRWIKLVFVAGLFIPSVSDAFGLSLMDAASLIVVALIVILAIYYEYRIYRVLREEKGE